MKKFLLAALAILVIATLLPLPFGPTRLGQQIQNSGHLVLGAILAMVLVAWFAQPGRFARHGHFYAFVAAAAILAVLELAQYPLARDASIYDLALGVLAAASVVVGHFGLNHYRTGTRFACLTVSVVLMLAGISPLLAQSAAYLERDLRFPVLGSFASLTGRLFVETRHADLIPLAGADLMGSLVASLCLRDERWAGLTLDEVFPDWTGYDYLAFEIESLSTADTTLTLRVNDRRHNLNYNDRFNTALELSPDLNRIAIPVAMIRAIPSGREMQMTLIDRIVLFSPKPDSRVCYKISDFSLIRGEPETGFRIIEPPG